MGCREQMDVTGQVLSRSLVPRLREDLPSNEELYLATAANRTHVTCLTDAVSFPQKVRRGWLSSNPRNLICRTKTLSWQICVSSLFTSATRNAGMKVGGIYLVLLPVIEHNEVLG